MLAFSLGSAPQLPGNSQMYLTHYKRGCLPLLTLLFSCSCSYSLSLSLHPLLPLFPGAHGCPPLSLSVSLSLNSYPNALNKLFCTIQSCGWNLRGGRDASAWAHRGIPFPHTIPHLHQTHLWSFFLQNTTITSTTMPD